LRKGKWRYSDRLYKYSGARWSAETPKLTSFRAWPGIQCTSLHGSRINVTSRARWRPGWRMFGSSGQCLYASFRARSGVQKQPSPSPKPTSFRAWPGIQCARGLRSVVIILPPSGLPTQF